VDQALTRRLFAEAHTGKVPDTRCQGDCVHLVEDGGETSSFALARVRRGDPRRGRVRRVWLVHIEFTGLVTGAWEDLIQGGITVALQYRPLPIPASRVNTDDKIFVPVPFLGFI
jgi:hypothetical protein